jgi:DNA-binding Lrp family transcriptional regulator
MMTPTLDPLDKKLLELLRVNARLPVVKLAQA